MEAVVSSVQKARSASSLGIRKPPVLRDGPKKLCDSTFTSIFSNEADWKLPNGQPINRSGYPEYCAGQIFRQRRKANTLLSFVFRFSRKTNWSESILPNPHSTNTASLTVGFKIFDRNVNRKDIPIRNVNHDFVYQFRIYLKADKKLSINSSEKLMRIFKRITTFAFKTELILCNPFAFYTKRTGGLTEGVR